MISQKLKAEFTKRDAEGKAQFAYSQHVVQRELFVIDGSVVFLVVFANGEESEQILRGFPVPSLPLLLCPLQLSEGSLNTTSRGEEQPPLATAEFCDTDLSSHCSQCLCERHNHGPGLV